MEVFVSALHSNPNVFLAVSSFEYGPNTHTFSQVPGTAVERLTEALLLSANCFAIADDIESCAVQPAVASHTQDARKSRLLIWGLTFKLSRWRERAKPAVAGRLERRVRPPHRRTYRRWVASVPSITRSMRNCGKGPCRFSNRSRPLPNSTGARAISSSSTTPRFRYC